MAEDDAGLNWGQVAVAAAAAMSAALLLSTLGVAGTIVGAAIGSVVANVATHAYSRGIRASRSHAKAVSRIGRARDDLERVASHPGLDHESELEDADLALGRAEAALAGRRRLPWKRIALGSIILFVGVMVAITAFELATGRAVSSFTGGSDEGTQTTIPGVGQREEDPTPPRAPTDTPTGTPTVSEAPSPSETPSEAPSETPSESGASPSETAVG